MLFIYYPKCSTCQKAKKWLDAQEISYTERHIVEENPTYEELKKWQARSGLPIKKFFNTSGMLYKEMQLKDKLPQMSEDEQLKLLATNGMLVKRPVIVDGDTVLTGFREKEWEQKFPFLREKGHVVSLIGGGGKTTLLYALSAYCTAKGWRVLTATTTHIRKPVNVPWIVVNEEENTAWENARKERDRLWQQGTYVVAGTPAPHEKLTILPESIRSEWISDADITFLEADGAKCLPCKFPAAYEPVILPQSDIVLAVAGLSALYRPLGEVCFRAELAIEAWNRDVCEYGDAAYPKEGKRLLKEVPISKDTPLTPELLAWLLGSENGARKDISGRSFFVVLNQADTSERREDGRKVLDILKHSYGIQGILTSFSETERNQG